MRCLSIGTSGFLAHDDNLAGFFTNESLKASGAIHLVEQRKLSKEETDKFLKDVDTVEDIDTEPTPEDYNILNNIARYYPEMRYFVHGLKITAAKPSKKKRKQMADELRTKEENRKKADKAKKDKRDKTGKTIEVDYGKNPDGTEKTKTNKTKLQEIKDFILHTKDTDIKKLSLDAAKKLETSAYDHGKNLSFIQNGLTGASEEQKDYAKKLQSSLSSIKRKCGEKIVSLGGEPIEPLDPVAPLPAEQAKEEKEEKEEPLDKKREAERKEKLKQAEQNIQKSGKYSGMTGLFLKILDGWPDPKTIEEREKTLKRLQKEWKTYRVNEKIYNKNKDLVKALQKGLDSGSLDPDSVTIFNEIMANDPAWANTLDVGEKEQEFHMPLGVLEKSIGGDIAKMSSEEVQKKVADFLKSKGLSGIHYTLDFKKNKFSTRNDTNTAIRLLSAFDIKSKDIVLK